MKKLLPIFIITVLALSFRLSASAAGQFSDISDGTEFASKANDLRNKGIFTGYPDNTFRPETTLNRAEALKIIFRANEVNVGKKIDETLLFPDVFVTDWFAPYVESAQRIGFLSGYPDGTFKPGNKMNRAEFIKIAIASLPYYRELTTDEKKTVLAQLPNENSNAWYTPYLAFAQYFAFIDITPSFDPTKEISRGEAADMVYNMSVFHESLWKTTNKCKKDCIEDQHIINLVEAFHINPNSPAIPTKQIDIQALEADILKHYGLDQNNYSIEQLDENTSASFSYGDYYNHLKMRPLYKGIPLYKEEFYMTWRGEWNIAEEDIKISSFIDLEDVTPDVDKSAATTIAKNSKSYTDFIAKNVHNIVSETTELVIVPNVTDKTAVLAYAVSFLTDDVKEPFYEPGVYYEMAPPTKDYYLYYMIDANTGDIIREWGEYVDRDEFL